MLDRLFSARSSRFSTVSSWLILRSRTFSCFLRKSVFLRLTSAVCVTKVANNSGSTWIRLEKDKSRNLMSACITSICSNSFVMVLHGALFNTSLLMFHEVLLLRMSDNADRFLGFS